MPRSRGGLIEKLGTGVGFVSEYAAHRRSKSQQAAQVDAADSSVQQADRQHPAHTDDDKNSDSSDSDLEDDGDEAAWTLDEQHTPASPPAYQEHASEDQLVNTVLQVQAQQPPAYIRSRLECPVIIPQKRPGTKARGFVRAYAPVLQNVGIDQATFLAFLNSFQASIKTSPVFTVIQVSAVAAVAAGPGIGRAVQAVVSKGVNVGRQLESNYKTNSFLDKMNQELFQPAGTIAFLMKYKTSTDQDTSTITTSQVELGSNRTQATNTAAQPLNQSMQKFKIVSGTTHGAGELAVSAPLIYPAIDEHIAQHGKESFTGKARDAQAVMQDYLDRREQIKFSRADPQSGLLVPEEQRQMRSSMADPDHPMYKNGPLGLISGGLISRPRRSRERRERRTRPGYRSRRDGRQTAESSSAYGSRRAARQDRRRVRQQASLRGATSRLINEGIIYLMIVDLKAEEQ